MKELSIDSLRMLMWFYLGWTCVLAKREVPPEPSQRPMMCENCGGSLRLVEITDHLGRVNYRAASPYLDSS